MKSYFNAQRRTQDFEKGGGGSQKLQKIWEKHISEFEIVTLKFRPIFRPKSGEEQKKKGLHSNFVPFFALLFRSLPKYQVISSSEPDAQLAEGGHASIFLTFLSNFAILATQKGGP